MVRTKTVVQCGVMAMALAFLPACAKHGLGLNGMQANGLGQFGKFAGQEEGESYTTQAPHNQIYLFDYDSSNLASKYMPSIHAQAEYLKGHPGAKVLLAGHTDERGSREYNIALGEHRAKKVAHILRMAGVASSQIRVVSYGKERPAYTGNNQESYRQNRRVEFTYEATR